jgi:hypothetical protein
MPKEVITGPTLDWPDHNRGPHHLTLWLAEIEGRLECIGLFIGSFQFSMAAGALEPIREDFEPLTSTDLRTVPVASLVDDFIARPAGVISRLTQEELASLVEHRPLDRKLMDWLREPDGLALELVTKARQRARRHSRKTQARSGSSSRQRLNKEFLEQVAGIYRQAYTNHQPPTKAVSEKLGEVLGREVSSSTAAHWVRVARKEGYLPPTRSGKAGWIEPKETKP